MKFLFTLAAVFSFGGTARALAPQYIQVSGGRTVTCAVDDEGLKCWAEDYPKDFDKTIPAVHHARQVSAAGDHACVLADEGVKCWGPDSPGAAPTLTNPRQVTTGLSHACALDDSGVKCWGAGPAGELAVPTLRNPRQIRSGAQHVCALDDSGVVCWGHGDEGELNVPRLVNPTQVTAGASHTCALDQEGVKCWGSDAYGQLRVPALKNPYQIAAGFRHTCALDQEGVKCWGSNLGGQVNVPALKSPTQITAGAYYTCAFDDTGTHCWGQNANGVDFIPPLQHPTALKKIYGMGCALDEGVVKCWNDHQPTPPQPAFQNPRQLAVGMHNACVLDDAGVKCWRVDDLSLLPVPPLLHPRQVIVGSDNFVCVLDDEGVKCWNSRSGEPMLVPPLRNPTQISANWEQACALHDGGVKCWDTKGAAYVPLSDHAKFVSAGAPCVASDSEVLCWKVESGRVRVSRASNFSQISQMADNDSSACVLSAAGVDCRGWGGPSYVPPLRNPTRVLGSYCAVDDFGLRCWWGPSREPHFASSSFSAMRAEIPKGTTPARAAYLAALFAFAEKNFAAEGSLSPDAYALFALTEPAVTSMDSAYYQESVIPKFAREAGYLNQRYGSANLRDGLLHAPDGELLRRVIFEALRASLSVAADFLDAPGRGAIEGAMRSLGACVGDPMNQQNAAALLASLDSLSAVTAKLAASPKSAFLGETIRLAADGLRAKVNP